ncbi:Fe-S cluster assembly protein SufD [Arachidicoccus ginsenosidivorans]|uniref:Fe-S cluster assembly protein SufD n=1 Tax=Arachidicoccus ginsenosidivorans TaxID=496057 RepID=A0A5B8VNF5_9BACT|nr:Fe-S cluster assembly protein SufD [Arachidicoccus ginsenosidivorans]QEC72631.1 Fe-S cluster assembly protein SufD [Arachidicoccus ginsenosidivorans]
MSQQVVENSNSLSLKDSLIKEFELTYSKNQGNEPEALLQKREAALGAFQCAGIPTIKNEEWRFTNLVPFLKDSYQMQPSGMPGSDVIEKAIVRATVKGLDAYRLVLVNGQIDFSFSQLPDYQEGWLIRPVSEVKGTEAFAAALNSTLPIEKYPFAAINTACFSDGFYMELNNDFQLDKPLQIIHVYSDQENLFLQPRNIIKVRRGALAEVLESSVLMSDKLLFVNGVTEIQVQENAHFKHAHFQVGEAQERWIMHTQVEQLRDSRYDNYTLTLPHADLVRNNLNVILDGPSTETHLYGLYMVENKHVVDNHSLVDHRHPNCMSNQLYKGVILDGGKGVFNGKIYVHRPAQKTNAFQQNNNLLFTPNGTINSKPQLEIYADDVKCSHGSTVGQFDEEALFYLRSRGIGADTAHSLMITAFAFDVTSKIENEALRNHIEQLIEKTIAQAQAVI